MTMRGLRRTHSGTLATRGIHSELNQPKLKMSNLLEWAAKPYPMLVIPSVYSFNRAFCLTILLDFRIERKLAVLHFLQIGGAYSDGFTAVDVNFE